LSGREEVASKRPNSGGGSSGGGHGEVRMVVGTGVGGSS
jgi:hypothetical protein